MWKPAEAFGSPPFPALFDSFRRFKTTFFYLCFCFACYPVQSLSRQYKTLSPFQGGGGIKAIPRTALLLSKIIKLMLTITIYFNVYRLHRVPSDFATPKVRDSFVSKFVYDTEEDQVKKSIDIKNYLSLVKFSKY